MIDNIDYYTLISRSLTASSAEGEEEANFKSLIKNFYSLIAT